MHKQKRLSRGKITCMNIYLGGREHYFSTTFLLSLRWGASKRGWRDWCVYYQSRQRSLFSIWNQCQASTSSCLVQFLLSFTAHLPCQSSFLKLFATSCGIGTQRQLSSVLETPKTAWLIDWELLQAMCSVTDILKTTSLTRSSYYRIKTDLRRNLSWLRTVNASQYHMFLYRLCSCAKIGTVLGSNFLAA